MRITLIAHGPTAGTQAGVFGDDTALLDHTPLGLRHVRDVWTAPEPACLQTAALLNPDGQPGATEVLDELRAPAMGEWTGLALEDVLARNPQVLQEWLKDPSVRAPGGESLAEHLARIGATFDAHAWPDAAAMVVATPFTVRAACVHALGGDARTLGHLDIAPGTRVRISRHAGIWRLSAVIPPRFCSTPGARSDA